MAAETVHRLKISPEAAAKLLTAAFKDVGHTKDGNITAVTRKKVRCQMNSAGVRAFLGLQDRPVEGQ